MAWIELHQALWKHPKVVRLAQLLGVKDKDHARVKLENLWLWALDYCVKGTLTVAERPLTAEEIADASEWHGNSEKWLDALIQAGWIDVDENTKAMYLHDWQHYGGKYQDARDRERERSRTRRTAGRPPVGRRLTAGQPLADNTRGDKIRGDKIRREDIQKEGGFACASPPLPPEDLLSPNQEGEEEEPRTQEPAREETQAPEPTPVASPPSTFVPPSFLADLAGGLANAKRADYGPATNSPQEEVIRQLMQAVAEAECPNNEGTVRKWVTSWRARYGAQAVEKYWRDGANRGKDLIVANSDLTRMHDNDKRPF